MTVSQYKNILQWSLYMDRRLEKQSNLVVVKALLDNLGVSFPSGDYKTVAAVLKTNMFLGWRFISYNDAQKYADIGFATLAVGQGKVVIIRPDDRVSNLSFDSKLAQIKNANVVHTSELLPKERETMQFYAYRYGFALDKEKDKRKK